MLHKFFVDTPIRGWLNDPTFWRWELVEWFPQPVIALFLQHKTVHLTLAVPLVQPIRLLYNLLSKAFNAFSVGQLLLPPANPAATNSLFNIDFNTFINIKMLLKVGRLDTPSFSLSGIVNSFDLITISFFSRSDLTYLLSRQLSWSFQLHDNYLYVYRAYRVLNLFCWSFNCYHSHSSNHYDFILSYDLI